jgi:hypothetical protein
MAAGIEAAKAPKAKVADETNVTATTAGGGTATGKIKINPLEIISTGLSVGSMLPNIFEWVDFVTEDPEALDPIKKKVKKGLSIVDLLVFAIDVITLCVGEKRFKRWECSGIILATAIGTIRIVSLFPWVLEEWPDIVMALPEFFSFTLLFKNAYVVGFTLVAADLASSAMAVFNWPVSLQDGLWETWS